MLRKFLALAVLLLSLLSLPASSVAADLVKVPTGWLDEYETFLIWYAKEKGWDAEVGLDVEIKYFTSGTEVLNALPAGEWVFAGMSGVAALLGSLRHDTIIIANGNDESMTNGVVVRPDSEIARIRGWNKDYPQVLGSPESIRGKTFLVTTDSSAHYALSSWLSIFALSESDVVIRHMDQAQAVAAFENNIGDGVALWSPYLFLALEKGSVLAADLRKCGTGNPIVIVADRRYAEKHPEITAKFLGLYLRAVAELQPLPPESLVSEYLRFFQEWAGKEYSRELALLDLQQHPVYTLTEQLQLFDDSKGQSLAQRWQATIATFFASVGRISPEELMRVGDGKYATDTYLKLVTKPTPTTAP